MVKPRRIKSAVHVPRKEAKRNALWENLKERDKTEDGLFEERIISEWI